MIDHQIMASILWICDLSKNVPWPKVGLDQTISWGHGHQTTSTDFAHKKDS